MQTNIFAFWSFDFIILRTQRNGNYKEKTMSQQKVLVIGATGAMGRYLVPFLAEQGYRVDGVSFDDAVSSNPNVTYIKMNAKDAAAMSKLLENNYDAIVDFMTYPSAELSFAIPRMLDHTGHYLFLSSGRVYDNLEQPVRETSPRLLDTCKDPFLLNSDDYCIYKARGENLLRSMSRKNWTIIRPATTYSFMRYQLVTLEAANNVGRAFAGKAVVLPIQAKNVSATLSWGGDAARMIGKLVLLDKAMGEAYNINSAEHRTWGEIADYYKDICNLKAVWVDKEDYLSILQPDPYIRSSRWQLEYARLFERVVDNSKVLEATGLKQSEMIPMYDGLKMEISRCPRDHQWNVNKRMDDYLATMKIKE